MSGFKMHTSRFVELAEAAKKNIEETNVDAVRHRQLEGEQLYLIDVREDHEWVQGHLPAAIHMGKGIIERDIEKLTPDTEAELLLYCGGGYRSAIAAESLRKMGYTNAMSVEGGFKAWVREGFPVSYDE
jgi:rhodanese-related sulfurtransferase